MQCLQARQMLDEYLDGDLPALQKEKLAQHFFACKSCNQQWLFAQSLQRQLQSMPYPPPYAGFAERVINAVTAPAQARRQRYGFAVGFASAIAATLVVWLVVASQYTAQTPAGDGVINIELAAEETKKIDLVFNSPLGIESATLRLELSDNIELAGYPAKRQLEWQTSLHKGTNRLTLPLIARGNKGGQIMASIASGGKKKIFYLKVVPKGSPSAKTLVVSPLLT